MVIQAQEKLYTVEEFWEIVKLPENEERRLELDEGVIVDVGASSKRNTVVTGRLIHFLNAHVIPNNLGVVTTPNAGFKLGRRKYRQPDAAFISGAASSVDLEGTYFTDAAGESKSSGS
jgi:Uma2 family endonuclease